MLDKIKKLKDLLYSSNKSIVLTGAGISTDSGIPDYRSPEKGLWNKIDQTVVSIDGFLQNPEKYYHYALDLYPIRKAAKPNSAHKALSRLEQEGLLKAVITQNVDGLHQDAGSTKVYELHGSTTKVTCLSCGRRFSMEVAMEKVLSGENPPLCSCNGVLKPDAVFFGEALPKKTWEAATKLAIDSDLLIVVGTSLQVFPVSSLPSVALESGSGLVIVNLGKTPFDEQADLLVNENIGDFFQEFSEYCSKK